MLLISFWLQKSIRSSSPVILVVNKIDCAPSARTKWVDKDCDSFCKRVFTCAVTGEGIHDLERTILEIVGLNRIPAGGRKWTVNQVRYLSPTHQLSIANFSRYVDLYGLLSNVELMSVLSLIKFMVLG